MKQKNNNMTPIEIFNHLNILYPDAHCELVHHDAYTLSISVILSAQTTDAAVNKITPNLFKKYPTVYDLAKADQKEVEGYIQSIGLYRNKAQSIIGFSKEVVTKHEGVIPDTFTKLIALPGVGQKTANVILSVWYHVPRIAVDTHVNRVSKRLRLVYQKDDVYTVEKKLMKKFPQENWSMLHHQMIFFGRYLCKSQNPECERCPFTGFCYYYKHNKKGK